MASDLGLGTIAGRMLMALLAELQAEGLHAALVVFDGTSSAAAVTTEPDLVASELEEAARRMRVLENWRSETQGLA